MLKIRERCEAAPPGASVRGVWFSMPQKHAARLGTAEAIAFERMCGKQQRTPFRMYPLTQFLEELAVAAALADASDPVAALRKIWFDATAVYVATPFGRSLVRLLRPNPLRYLRWLATHRDHFCTYGVTRLEEHSPTRATFVLEDEYIWIDSAHRGGAEGLLHACGVEGGVDAELTGKYSGRLHFHWALSH